VLMEAQSRTVILQIESKDNLVRWPLPKFTPERLSD